MWFLAVVFQFFPDYFILGMYFLFKVSSSIEHCSHCLNMLSKIFFWKAIHAQNSLRLEENFNSVTAFSWLRYLFYDPFTEKAHNFSITNLALIFGCLSPALSPPFCYILLLPIFIAILLVSMWQLMTFCELFVAEMSLCSGRQRGNAKMVARCFEFEREFTHRFSFSWYRNNL